jgi:hypothetical protein
MQQFKLVARKAANTNMNILSIFYFSSITCLFSIN